MLRDLKAAVLLVRTRPGPRMLLLLSRLGHVAARARRQTPYLIQHFAPLSEGAFLNPLVTVPEKWTNTCHLDCCFDRFTAPKTLLARSGAA